MKLYGSDALHGFCGVPSKSCMPDTFVKHIGQEVAERPFNMYFKLDTPTGLRQINVLYVNQSEIVQSENVSYLIKTVNPHYHRCNESFKYGDLEYGAKCSCKVSFKFLSM